MFHVGGVRCSSCLVFLQGRERNYVGGSGCGSGMGISCGGLTHLVATSYAQGRQFEVYKVEIERGSQNL